MSERLVGGLTATVAVLTLPLGILAALFLGLQTAAVVFVVGWLLLTPLIPIVGGTLLAGSSDIEGAIMDSDPNESTSDDAEDALERLKTRYANGEIDEAEFERRVERLVAVEDLDIADDVDPSDVDPEANLEREIE